MTIISLLGETIGVPTAVSCTASLLQERQRERERVGGGDDRGRGEEDKKGKRERRQERKRMNRKLWKGVRIEEGEGKEATHGDGGREGGKDLWSGKRFTAYVSLSLSLLFLATHFKTRELNSGRLSRATFQSSLATETGSQHEQHQHPQRVG